MTKTGSETNVSKFKSENEVPGKVQGERSLDNQYRTLLENLVVTELIPLIHKEAGHT